MNMYFENKFDKAFTTLLALQKQRGGILELNDVTNPFWRIETESYSDKNEQILAVQPLLMFNTLTSTNLEDVVIQDYDVQIDTFDDNRLIMDADTCTLKLSKVDALTPNVIDQEILCHNKKDTVVYATYNPNRKPRDDDYICNTGMELKGDTVHDIIDGDQLANEVTLGVN